MATGHDGKGVHQIALWQLLVPVHIQSGMRAAAGIHTLTVLWVLFSVDGKID